MSSNRTQFYTGGHQSAHRAPAQMASSSASASVSASASTAEDLVSPLTLRQLVLNYLLHYSYVETATAFAKDIETTASSYPDGDTTTTTPPQQHELESTELDLLAVRKQVRDAILSGHIPLAIEIINTHFPTVLNANPAAVAEASLPASSSSRDVLMNGADSRSSLPPFHRTADSINPIPVTAATASATPSHNAPTLPDNPTSLDPAHLSLNLQIQDFIESVRAASQKGARARQMAAAGGAGSGAGNGYYGGGGGGSSSSSSHYHSQAQAMSSSIASLASTSSCASASTALSRPTSPIPAHPHHPHHAAGATSSSSAASSSLHHQATTQHHSNSTSAVLYSAIAHAQSLYRAVDALPSYWQALYRKELEKVTSLLAYTELEGSPVKQLLHPNRRVALAEQINSAILYRTGRPSQPLIETAARQTSYVWAQLAADRIAVPAGHPLLSQMAPSSTSNVGGASSSSSSAAAAAAAAANAANASSATLAGLNSSLAALVQASHANSAGVTSGSTSTSASKSDQRRGGTGPSSSAKETGKVLQSWNLSSFLNSR
ncbi:hypothetical protein OC845_003007 [Tilletia horrida]|nr:hypothetical protein OC845_003007 [Tilletia horrida]